MNSIITFALAKGRLAEKAVEILEECGVACKNILEPTRKLTLFDKSGKFKFIFVKPSDVPVYVEYGVADIGVCGKDTLLEENRNVYEMIDLNFAKCKLCLAGYKDFDLNTTYSTIKVATKYKNVSEKYFSSKGQNVEIITLHGSIELGPIVGLSDIILDVVESGKTLQENNLTVLEEICESSARLIVNRVSLKTKSRDIRPLADKIQQYVRNRV